METGPLIVIVGPTASGKTALSLELARRYGGEIICADSRTVYKGMDIGTAKPTQEEQRIVPHWGLDLVEPNERFTAARFQRYAKDKIEDIRSRKKIPFLVGGTGLYIDAVIFDYDFGPDRSLQRRNELEAMTLEELVDYCHKHNFLLPENNKNKRYVIRTIEQETVNNRRRSKPLDNAIIVGIATKTDDLKMRIATRSEQLFAQGMVEEAILLGKKYGWETESMTGNIYRIVHSYLKNEITLTEMQHIFAIKDWQLAKRQMTWLKRNPFIEWMNLEEAGLYLARQLEKHYES